MDGPTSISTPARSSRCRPVSARSRRRCTSRGGRGSTTPATTSTAGATRPLIPPAYGLSGVHSVTYTGDGDRISYWNRYVAVTQMHGHGSFSEPRLGIDVSNPPDMVESKLADARGIPAEPREPAPRRPAASMRRRPRGAGRSSPGRGDAPGAMSGSDAHRCRHADCISRRRFPPIRPTRSAAPPRCTGPRRFAALWRTRRTSTTAARPRWRTWCSATTQFLGLGLTADQMADLIEYLKSL